MLAVVKRSGWDRQKISKPTVTKVLADMWCYIVIVIITSHHQVCIGPALHHTSTLIFHPDGQANFMRSKLAQEHPWGARLQFYVKHVIDKHVIDNHVDLFVFHKHWKTVENNASPAVDWSCLASFISDGTHKHLFLVSLQLLSQEACRYFTVGPCCMLPEAWYNLLSTVSHFIV